MPSPGSQGGGSAPEEGSEALGVGRVRGHTTHCRPDQVAVGPGARTLWRELTSLPKVKSLCIHGTLLCVYASTPVSRGWVTTEFALNEPSACSCKDTDKKV